MFQIQTHNNERGGANFVEGHTTGSEAMFLLFGKLFLDLCLGKR
jgi:hypothetical protein